MEPVRVACPNCRGKLVVRSAWLLGQTVICPRCKSPVLLPNSSELTASPGVAPVTYDSSAITRVDDGQLAQRLSEASDHRGGLLDADGATFESAIESFMPLHEDLSRNSPPSELTQHRTIEEAADLDTMTSDGATAASRMLDWNPPSTKRRRQILLIAMAGIAATLAATGGLIAFLSMHTAHPVASPIAVEKAESQSAAAPKISIDEQPSLAIEPVVAEVDSVALDQNKLPDSVAVNLPINNIDKTIPEPNPVSADSREAIDPHIGNEPSKNTAEILEMPESMKRLSQVFDPGSLTLLPDAFGPEKPTDGSEAGPEKIDIETLYHPPSVHLPTWDEIQSVQLGGVATKASIPLNQLLIILGQLSGGGLGWDRDAIRLSGFDIDQPVSLSVQNISIGEILSDLCDRNQLAIAIDRQGQPLFRPMPNEIVHRLPSDWSIEDLATQKASLAAWQDLLKQFFPSSIDRWQWTGSGLQWTEAATPIQQATVAAFLDQIRLAHGLPPKSTLPTSVIDPRLGLEASSRYLSRTGTRIIEHAMSWPQLLDIAARDVQLKLIFDWERLAAHGFSHLKTTTSLLRGRNWSEIAKWGLDEFGLVAVVDGADQIVLTTLPYQRRMWRTLIFKLDSGRTVESLRESLRLLSPTDEQGRSMLLISPIPQVGELPATCVAVRICPPNTFQLQSRAVREALQLPDLNQKPR